MTGIFNFLMIAGAVQGFIFNVATFLSRKKIERPVLFLNLFVFFLSLNNLQSWFLEKHFVDSKFELANFTLPWYVLIVPMFYAFLVHYLEIEKEITSFVRISIGVFGIELLTRAVIIVMVNNSVWPPFLPELYNNIEDVVTLSYSLFLFFKSAQIVFGKSYDISPVIDFDDLYWLKWFFYLGMGVFLLWILAIFFNITELVKKPYSYYPLRLASSILIYWVGYQAFFRYVVLKDRIILRKEVRKKSRTEHSVKVRVDRGAITFAEIERIILREQEYLDPYLSLEKLSEKVNKSVSTVSKLMNTYTNGNFTDYINKYRVEEAKALLSNPKFSYYTVASIGLECGFNSKSTFYPAFKKFTDLTPTEFRNNMGR
ncbi:AraC family transcriptional regulator [Maribacter litopenaei]|uniref:AraC family transcriptional regulator n=1 Tax=Maribacter litopenaei TaxID=2976127 RepID=A0ABY5YA23_9FLAO|nr:AraC family transcriptional regulator [Maribacter litopenaei]UWX55554.1 AraC family transcriptional regulator [Maribacter litopenaei]